jgi:hypothetical protein
VSAGAALAVKVEVPGVGVLGADLAVVTRGGPVVVFAGVLGRRAPGAGGLPDRVLRREQGSDAPVRGTGAIEAVAYLAGSWFTENLGGVA